MTRLNLHVRPPFTPKRWSLDSTAYVVNAAEDRQRTASILAACEAVGRTRAEWASRDAHKGDFAMLDGRWHRIAGFVKHRGRDRLELQDVAYPDMPRHHVAWSEIERVARITDH